MRMALPSDPFDAESAASSPEAGADGEDGGSKGVELSIEQLSEVALQGLIEEYITREGTDYGNSSSPLGAAADPHAEWSLEEKVAQVYRQLESGDARIVFDLELETASIVPADALAAHLRGVRDAGGGDGDADGTQSD